MSKTPRFEHSRHGSFARLGRSGRFGAWIKQRASALSILPAQVFALLQSNGATRLSQATSAKPMLQRRGTISGTAKVGLPLTFAAGLWGGKPTPTLTRQWLANGVVIAGQSGTSYTALIGDVGKRISVTETATNTAGVVSSTSLQTSAVSA